VDVYSIFFAVTRNVFHNLRNDVHLMSGMNKIS